MNTGEPMSIREAYTEAIDNQKLWGRQAMIVMDGDNNCGLSTSLPEAVTGRLFTFTELFLVDSYEEAYLRVMGLDFHSTSYCSL